MRTIGMLGGMSWKSTAEYYRLTNELVAARLGGVHSARILLDSADFAEVERLQARDEWEAAGELLATRANALEGAGADLILICANTMHKVIGQVEEAVSVPVPHIADATAARVRAAGLERVALLGTAFTMEGAFYLDRLAEAGLETVIPGDGDRAAVHRVIYEELVRGVITDPSRQLYRGVIRRLVADGAEGVILGCTEIELLIGPDDSPVPVFPTTRIHVEAALDLALA